MTELRRSMVITLVIGVPLCAFGLASSMGLAHSGGLLVAVFIPTWPVFALFGSGGPFHGIPEPVFVALLVSAQLVGIFALVHVTRRVLRRKRDA